MLRGVRRSVSLLVVVLSGVMGACAASPTDQFVTISDGRTLAYAIARDQWATLRPDGLERRRMARLVERLGQRAANRGSAS